MTCTLEDLENALIEERITIDEFVQVLIDNFGRKKTKKILKYNLKLSMKKDRKKSLLGQS